MEQPYPIYFLTKAGTKFKKHKTKVSADGTPRYIPNPNSTATYSLETCLKEYTPVYSKTRLTNPPTAV